MCATGAPSGPHPTRVHLVDFKYAKRVRNMASGVHVPFRVGKRLTGSPRFASLRAHAGEEQSAADDLEALGYVLVYLARGKLPWQGLSAASKEAKVAAIVAMKRDLPVHALCDGLPGAFAEFIVLCRSMRFAETPQYDRMACLFKGLEEPDAAKSRAVP